MSPLQKKRILIVDDNPSIHKDFEKIFKKDDFDQNLADKEEILFNKKPKSARVSKSISYKIDSAYQGQEALEMVNKAMKLGEPYFLAFIDMIMPPGWDGIKTIKSLWEVDPHIQVVICSAHSEYSWEDITEQLGITDNLLFLKKPFEVIEISQFCSALTKKWELRQQVQYQIENLQSIVKERTFDLQNSLSLTNATLEATEEGIIVLSLNKSIVRYNQKFLKIWKISHEAESLEPYQLFQKLAAQVEDSTFFLKTMMCLGDTTDHEPLKELTLKTGEILEFYRTPQYLEEKIIGTVCSFRDITERKRLEEQLLYQATHDSLTLLPNRLLLGDRIQQAIIHAKRYGLYVAIILFDLDYFKQINDTYGHKTGDALLQAVAKRIKESLREGDTLARLGGDEFVIVLPAQTKIKNFVSLVEKLIKEFSVPFIIEDQEINCSASMGISVYPEDGKQIEQLLKSSDIALYQSKESGRGAFQFYKEDFDKEFSQKALLSSDLYHALEKKELAIHYQPLVELATTKVMGVEALLRWHHPILGEVLPNEFISVAEKLGLIVPIGEWALKTACTQVKSWHDKGFFPLHLAISVSAQQFRQKKFVPFIRQVLKETGLTPECLELDISESLILENYTEFSDKMSQLKEMGIHLSIDDFGTGYSNLNQLKYFPFDKIKINKAFIDEASDSNNNSIADLIIRLSKKMEMSVVAEGVEKQEQVQYLRKQLGDQVQGYYYSAPLDNKACAKLLKSGYQPL